MKVGILTIYGGSNFGNKLQNYAMQQFLKSKKIESETIRYTVSWEKNKLGKREKLSLLKEKYFSQGVAESIWNVKWIVSAKFHKSKLEAKKNTRCKKFEQFENKNIALSDIVLKNVEELREYSNKYDAVIVGSDQVWNPYWQGSLDEFFLTFVPKSKRVAYAPSIGVSEIPNEQKSRFKERLNGFSRLSCRENQGCKLVEELTGKECEHVCDPVFLLSPEQWQSKVSPVSEKYIVTYFLGGQSLEVHKEIEQYAKKHDCKIIDLWDEKDYTSSYAGIEEFLNYIANAKMFFTDSFHGCAFAILMETQFVVCERKAIDAKQKMNSRLDSLMAILDIQGRKLNDFVISPTEIDYKKVHNRLSPWVQRSQEYLLGCLEGIR